MSDHPTPSDSDHELANRLDSLFDDEDAAPGAPQGVSKADPLDELRSLVMSIEWEITDEIMDRFIAQVESLRTRYSEDRILIMFLQLLGSLGLYVKTNKGKGHPTAFRLLNSVYDGFAKAATPGKMSSSERKKLLYLELNKYKELKEQIDALRDPRKELPRAPAAVATVDAKPASQVAKRPAPVEAEDAAEIGALSAEALVSELVTAIKELLQSEFAQLREELRQMLAK